MAGQETTIVEYFAEHEHYRCGYCGAPDTNYSHGMWAHSMSVQDYQDLLDRGWRRSGKYTYKPTMNMLCCPMYTIRCQALNFQLRKSHKKVIKRVNRFLIEGKRHDKEPDDMQNDSVQKQEQSEKASTSKCTESMSTESETAVGKETEKCSKTPRPGSGPDPNKPRCKKAKELRREKKLAKLKTDEAAGSQGSSSNKMSNSDKNSKGKDLEELLSEPERAGKLAHKLEIRLVRSSPASEEFTKSLKESHRVYHRYQMAIHMDPEDKPTLKQFTRFLIDSPLEPRYVEGGLPAGYGSFHQQYILDGKIICVGVIDILPSLVSSKYLYYDPDYDFLSLGTYSALREMAFVRELHTYSQQMIYYYMGFYIHSCPKMKYKGQYFPSYLLCPETYTWHPVEKCSPMLDQKVYCRFADADKDDENGKIELEKVLILHKHRIMSYAQYKRMKGSNNNDEEEVKEYAEFVGNKSAQKILLFRS